MVAKLLTRTNCTFVGMNYLGHAYLSFNHPQILAGNLVSDFLKGKAVFRLNGNIQKGIKLHRAIDQFTDAHQATAEAKKIFYPHYRLYSSPIIDILFDHYLANDPQIFTDQSLKQFTQNTYALLEGQAADLPHNFLQVLFWMKKQNWLYHYQYHDGIRKSLAGLQKRANYMKETDTAFQLFKENYELLEEHYKSFIEDVKQFAKQEFSNLIQ